MGIYKFFVLGAMVVAATSCNARTIINGGSNQLVAEGPMQTRTVNASGFDAIEAAMVKVVYTPGAGNGTVTINAPESVMEYVEVEVRRGTLKCRIREGYSVRNGADQITVTVTAPGVDDFEASLSAAIQVSGAISTRELEASASTSGRVTFGNVSCTSDVELGATTSGRVTIAALQCDDLEIETSTSGNVSVATATCTSVDAEASTSGSVTIAGGRADKATYSATTSGSIDASALNAHRGSADASTGGSISCTIENASSMSSSTGGSIRR